MPQKNYFVTFLYFDTKHQRSNKLSHLSIAIMEGEKNSDFHVSKMKLLSSYGYYSHRIPSMAERSTLEKTLEIFFRVTFRIRGSYAEFKKEELINIDLGFGIEGGPIIEITPEEKAALEANIQTILENEENFFGEIDLKAKEEVDNLIWPDNKTKEKKYIELRDNLREKHYLAELEKIDNFTNVGNVGPDLLIEETARESGLISARRFEQEKLKLLKNIDLFEFDLSPQGRTCKTMGIELVINSLSHNRSGQIRKLLLSELLTEGFYTNAIPRLTKGISKFIFNSEQNEYSSTFGKPPFPRRTWDDEGICCSLIFFEENKYTDLNGVEHELKEIEYKKKYVLLIENLIHLKRLLNDFCSEENGNQMYIQLIDQTISALIEYANNIRQVIDIYHATIKNLKELGCFKSISKDILKTEQEFDSIKNLTSYIKQQHIKLEDGLLVEIKRLNMIKKHINLSFIYQEIFDQPKVRLPFFSKKFAHKEIDNSNLIELDDLNSNQGEPICSRKN